MPMGVGAITREHVESYIVEKVETRAANTAASEYRGFAEVLRLARRGGRDLPLPMERMKPVKPVEEPVRVLTDDDLRAILKACSITTFEDRRDSPTVNMVPGCTPAPACGRYQSLPLGVYQIAPPATVISIPLTA
jgi:integrase